MRTSPNTSRRYGWTPDHPDVRDWKYASVSKATPKIPQKVNLRGMCSAVEAQGELGSCTANALVGACEFIQDKDGARFRELSRLFIYYYERLLEGTVSVDSGASLRYGIRVLARRGVCSESLWPYDITKFKKKPSEACDSEALKHRVTAYARISGLRAMKQCLAEGFPFVFGFSVYDAFESDRVAKTGVLRMPGPKESLLGGHAVLCVGYDDDSETMLIKNSWGPQWGKKGYFTMPYDYISNDDLACDFWTIRGISGF